MKSSEVTPLRTNEEKNDDDQSKLSNRTKFKIGFYFMTLICSIGYIVSGIYGFTTIQKWSPSIEIIIFIYSSIGGVFLIAALLPLPTWKFAMEIWFPFMFSYLGRAAFFIIIGPLLIAAGSVGIAFGSISILNGISYLIAYFALRNDNCKKSFLHPFEKDRPDKEEYLPWEDNTPLMEPPKTSSNSPQKSQPTNTQYNPFDTKSDVLPKSTSVVPKDENVSLARVRVQSESSSVSSSPSPPISRNISVPADTKYTPDNNPPISSTSNPFSRNISVPADTKYTPDTNPPISGTSNPFDVLLNSQGVSVESPLSKSTSTTKEKTNNPFG